MERKCAHCGSIFDPDGEDSTGKSQCLLCGSEVFIDISDEEFQARLKELAKKENCCPNPECEPFLLPLSQRYCSFCASPLKKRSLELWFDKCVNPTLGERPGEIFQDIAPFIEAARKMGYGEHQVREKFEQRIRKLTGQPYKVTKEWVSYIKDQFAVWNESQNPLKESDMASISSARDSYLKSKNGEKVVGIILSPVSYKEEDHSTEQNSLKLQVNQSGEYIALRQGSKRREAWVFPRPNMEFGQNKFDVVFPNLRAEEYASGNITPRKARSGKKDSKVWTVEFAPRIVSGNIQELIQHLMSDAAKKEIDQGFARYILRKMGQLPITEETSLERPPEVLPAKTPSRPQDHSVPLIFSTPSSERERPLSKYLLVCLLLVSVVFISLALIYTQTQKSANSNRETQRTIDLASPASPNTEATSSNMAPVPLKMVFVPGGDFIMGNSQGDELSNAPHKVHVNDFYIDKFEVTCADYEKCLTEKRCTTPGGWREKVCLTEQDNFPVTNVTWAQAAAYARWNGKRLPTEEEWEYSARYPDGRIFPWGNSWSEGIEYLNNKALGPVGSYPQSDSSLGISDLIGNACEWTNADLTAYPGKTLPSNIEGIELKAVRGGYWRISGKEHTRAFYRGYWPPGLSGSTDMTDSEVDRNIGFRCAKNVAP